MNLFSEIASRDIVEVTESELEAEQEVVTSPTQPLTASGKLQHLGHQCRDCLEQTKYCFVALSVLLLAAKELMGTIGCSSKFPAWLAEHVPQLDRKTVDRLVSIADSFHLNADNLSDFEPLAEQFRLSALYQLARKGVPELARQEALKMAQAGQVITLAAASELIERHTIVDYAADQSQQKKMKIFRRSIELPAGKVNLAINHDDYRQALTEALEFVGEPEGSAHS